MADMATIAMKGQHWIIIDLIAASPAGKVSQAKIQEAFGPRAMMEYLEELFEANIVTNDAQMTRQGPKRIASVFMLSAEGFAYHQKNARHGATLAAKTKAEWAAEDSPQKPAKRGPGRPPGSKNEPKDDAPEPDGVE